MANPMVVSLVIKGSAEGVKQAVQSTQSGLAGIETSATAANGALARTTLALNGQRSVIGQATQATKLQSHEVTNLTYQLNDMGTMLASGQSPFMMIMQQGPQVSQILGKRGLGQILPAIGQGLMSLLTPVNLVLAGMLAVGYAGTAAWRMIYPEIEPLNDVLSRQSALLDDIKKSYDSASSSAAGYGGRSIAVLKVLAEEENKIIQQRLQGLVRETGLEFGLSGGGGGRSGGGGLQRNGAVYEAFSALGDSAAKGAPDFKKFQETLAGIASDKTFEANVRAQALALIKFTEEAAKAQGQLNAFGKRAAASEPNISLFRDYQRQNATDQARMLEANKAALQGMVARSPQELAAAARASEAAQIKQGENAQTRAMRIELAGTIALAKAQRTLTEAYRGRLAALDATMASAELDLKLIGQSALEVARLKMEYQLTGQVRAAAALAGVAADEQELALIREKAAVYARLKTLTDAREFIAGKDEELVRLKLEQQLIGTSANVRAQALAQYEAETEIRKRGIDLYGQEAQAIRALAKEHAAVTSEIERQNDAWGKVQQTGESVIDSLMEGDWESALKSLGKSLADLAIGNPLKNALLGTNHGTLDDLGGLSGLFAKLTGGADDSAAGAVASALGGSAVGSMMVTAGTVMVNGGVTGGIEGGLKSVLGDGFKENTTLGALLGVGGANSNYAPGAVTRTPLGDAMNWREAIKSIESAGSGGYGALGPLTSKGDRAYGAYQVMGNNLPSWTKEALGKSLTPQQFLNDPGAQDSVFDHFFGKSVAKYGNPQDAASVWFTGRPQSSGGSARDILGTSGNKYVDKFDTALSKLTTTTGESTTALGTMSKGLGDMGNGLGQFGQTLQQAGSGAGGAGGGGGWLAKLLGGLVGSDFLDGGDTFLGDWSSGGFTGYGGKYDRAGDVHKGEYVFNADATRKIGVGTLERMHRAANKGYAEGGLVGGGSGGGMRFGAPQIVFQNLGTPQRVTEQREEDDGKGGRRSVYVLDDMTAEQIGRRGSASQRALRSNFGLSGRTVARG